MSFPNLSDTKTTKNKRDNNVTDSHWHALQRPRFFSSFPLTFSRENAIFPHFLPPSVTGRSATQPKFDFLSFFSLPSGSTFIKISEGLFTVKVNGEISETGLFGFAEIRAV